MISGYVTLEVGTVSTQALVCAQVVMSKLKRAAILVLGLALLQGCQAMMYGTAANLNKMHIGMTRAEVVEQLGKPDTRSATQSEEILKYKWMKSVIGWLPTYFYVRLVDGRVVAFGEERELSGKDKQR